MATELILYSTEHCSLCETALDLLFSMPELGGGSVRVVDVADDAALTGRFGERLPVLACRRAGEAEGWVELDWPFDAQAVRELIGGGRADYGRR